MPANTGTAGAIHRVACFAGLPAPTVIAPVFRFCARQFPHNDHASACCISRACTRNAWQNGSTAADAGRWSGLISIT